MPPRKNKRDFTSVDDDANPVVHFDFGSLDLPAVQSAIQQIGSELKIGRFTLTPAGLVIPEDATPDECDSIQSVLLGLEGSLNWLIGDLLAFRERRGYGEIKSIAEALGLNYGRVRNLAWVAGAMPLSLRNDNLNWSIHALIVRLTAPDDYAYWLAEAQAHNWSVRELEAAIRGSAADSDADEPWLRTVSRVERLFSPRVFQQMPQTTQVMILNRLRALVNQLERSIES